MERLINQIEKGQLDYIRSFCLRLKDINQVLIDDENCNLNILHIATGVDSVYRDDVVKLIVTFDQLDINKPSGPGNHCFTAAHIAACNGFASTLQILLRHGADPYLLDINCNTVWDTAYGHPNCINVLEKESNYNTSEEEEEQSLYYSIQSLNLSKSERPSSSSGNNLVQQSRIYKQVELNYPIQKINQPLYQGSNCSKKRSSPKRTSSSSIRWNKKGPETSIYTDDDFNITLIEYKPDETLRASSVSGDVTLTVGNVTRLTDQELRQKLIRLGESPGPINSSTRELYRKKLSQLESRTLFIKSPTGKTLPLPNHPGFINDIALGKFDHEQAKRLEKEFVKSFEYSKGPSDFFNYLILDPRKTRNLPAQAQEQYNRKNISLFMKFIDAIFYIGKGKNNRPYLHLYEAAWYTKGIKKGKNEKKVQRIIEIWNQGLGVISLHCFNGMKSDEAFARESLMITAVGLDKLTNIRLGHSKIGNLDWTNTQKMLLGSYFLYKAFRLLLIDGERQIREIDVKS